MTKSILTAAFALMTGLTTSTFAETKNEANTKATEKTSPIETVSSAKTENGSNATAKAVLFWYSEDGGQSYGQGEEPSSGDCDVEGAGCAKGYTTAQPIPVPSSATPAETRGERPH